MTDKHPNPTSLLELAERHFSFGPMTKFRAAGWGMLITVLLGDWHVLGFNPAPEPQALIAIVGACIILAVCRAHDSIAAALKARADGEGQ